MNTEHFKKILQDEKLDLENRLKTVARKNPDNSEDWEATEPKLDVDAAESGEVADGIQEYENNAAISDQLETRLNEVKVALEKIEAGTYGTCEICGEPIETDRLKANAAAKTCKLHMND